jgi:hypothetical protein
VDDVAEVLLKRYRLRIEPEMSAYLRRQLCAAPADGRIPVIAGDARTGVAVRRLLAAGELLEAMRGSGASGG